jgi:hypothetical protein
MRTFIIAVITASLFSVHVGQTQTNSPSDKQSFLVRFPTAVDTTNLSIRYYITGSFGGYGGFVRTKPKGWEYLIDTHYEGKPAESLKAIFYCPGYGVELLNIPTLNASSVRSANIDLKPLSSVPLSGRIILSAGASDTELTVEVVYLAYWSHEFYGIADGMVATFKLGDTSMSQDGYFSVLIPDLIRDPVISRFRDKGELELRMLESKTGNIPYALERSDLPDRRAELKIAEKYSGELTLYAKPRNDR